MMSTEAVKNVWQTVNILQNIDSWAPWQVIAHITLHLSAWAAVTPEKQ